LVCLVTQIPIGLKPSDSSSSRLVAAELREVNHEWTRMNTNSAKSFSNYSCRFVFIRG
jgi:hypothetical protein